MENKNSKTRNEDGSRTDLVLAAEELLRQSTSGVDLKISAELHKPFADMGYVSVVGKSVVFDPRVFVAISKKAVNVEAYPMLNKLVAINFTFNRLTN